ncbi:Tagaturonate epimerase [Planctomycetales bacterium 10988]|nr:Tagaturonate epimerase [Planctomycetales bacterium 10988]
MKLEKFTFGVGDRFGHQASAQLRAFELIADQAEIIPVWNKSDREHRLIGSEPTAVKEAAAKAITERNWKKGWHIDADHINESTVDRFLSVSDFFTIDVADYIGKEADPQQIDAFTNKHLELLKPIELPGLTEPLILSTDQIKKTLNQYLAAIEEAKKVYSLIKDAKKEEPFFVEVSMDETDSPQTPMELLVILIALADKEIPLVTIAPKFTGRFNKGVDYVGDLTQFRKEFEEDLAVIAYAVEHYNLPQELKLSVHSGSDKFSLYPIINELLKKTGAGLHIKTAGTTWLEELIGLGEAGGEALEFAKSIYIKALNQADELCAPYATVIDIDQSQLPTAEEMQGYTSDQFVRALRHNQSDELYNPHMRQLLHVSFKLAAKEGAKFTDLLKEHHEIVGKNVTENLYERHMKPLFS